MMKFKYLISIFFIIVGICIFVEFFSRDGLGDELFILLFKEDTQYSSKYDEDVYNSIKIGDDINAIHNKLGSPLETWGYVDADGQSIIAFSYSKSATGNHFRRRDVHTTDGRVIEKVKVLHID